MGSAARFFHESGLADAQSIYLRLIEGGFDFTRRSAILDFGCGSGRVLRLLSRVADTQDLYGADVVREAIAWCRDNLAFARFEWLAARPSSRYPDRHFAGVNALAVFSQMEERLQLAWLAEIARITAPGAVVVLTTHGRQCAEEFARGNVAQFPFPAAERVRADLPVLEATGFLFYPYSVVDNVSLPVEDRALGLHGVAFTLEPHIREHWLAHFELVALHEAPRGFQDEVVLRRK